MAAKLGRSVWTLAPLLAVICALYTLSRTASAQVVITEIMYNPLQGSDYEFVEITNTGAGSVDISGWAFTDGVQFLFPAGTVIGSGERFVVCEDVDAFRGAYPAIPETRSFGNYQGRFGNDGERVTLIDDGGATVESFVYDDDAPWDFLADGFGASIERLCDSTTADDPINWRAGFAPPSIEVFGGSPAAANGAMQCPPESVTKPEVFISEVMYHPVLEEAFEDFHEFVEIHNAGAQSVSLAGWRLAGGIDFEFPEGASIPGDGYKVVAKSKDRLLDLDAYGLDASDVFGDYARTLDNGGEKVALIGSSGQGVDSMSYDDDAPWPIGADALGAGRSWLDPSLLPLEDHQYLGRSLERVSFSVASNEVANWVASPLDGATPAAENVGARATPLPVVDDILVLPDDATSSDDPIRSSDEVQIQASFTPAPPQGDVELEYFVENVQTTNETISRVDMHDDGTRGGDLIPGDGIYSVVLPRRTTNSIVRYRILANRGSGRERVSPRVSDPHDWHAYFVAPVINTDKRVYQIFISRANWTQMWNNTNGGRASGCSQSSTWNARVPAIFVYNDEVYDAQVRYQGSRWNRRNGPNISSWPYPGPTSPSPVKGLSWRVSLPRYKQVGGRGDLTLNKLTQSCPGFTSRVGYKLFEAVDLPSPFTRYVRLYINGGYYHMMMEYERPGEDFIRRYNRNQAEKYPEREREVVGHLYKSAGCNCDEGPYGWGDWRRLPARCGYSVEDRFDATFNRKTHDWDDYSDVIRLVDDLNSARSSGRAAIRQFIEENFDVDLLLNYMAVMNYQVPFDDMFQNHFVYQRRSDRRWLLAPWDLDRNFGGWKGANASFYMGEQGDPDNRSGWWHYLKDAVLESHRDEFENRLFELNNTVLHPDNINAIVDELVAEMDVAEANAAASPLSCSFSNGASQVRNFAATRFNLINSQLSSIRADAGPDQTVFAGETVQFDASQSRPAPGPGVVYEWSNGMSGESPSRVFPTAGEFDITLTIRADGQSLSDSVTITVLDAPDQVFVESGGRVVMEAESFWINDRHGSATCWWAADTDENGYSGASYMHAKETTYTKFSSNYATSAPELRYAIRFETPGTYRVWFHGHSASNQYDSVHVNLGGVARDESFATRFAVNANSFQWAGDTRSQGQQTVNVPNPGIHFLSVWVRESGQIIDKIVMTRDTGFTPTGLGPAESEVEGVDSTPTFVRGDSNGDGFLEISDAIATVLHLFVGASALECEDHGDFDDNGQLQVTDAIATLAFLFQEGVAPRAPYPDAGLDGTPDPFDCGEPVE